MERHGLDKDAVRIVNDAFKTIVRSGATLDDAVTDLSERYPDSPQVREMLDFAKASDRGLARPRG